jgi:urease accessory protein
VADWAIALERATEPQVALSFACTSEGRTWLSRQRAAYPFHVGRILSICGDPPRMASVYLQCCSGGLFENDDVRLEIEAASGAVAQVRTSAATIVHRMRGTQAQQSVALVAHEGSHLEYLPDSLILFPSARLTSTVDVVLNEQSSVLAGEIVLTHDPEGLDRSFDRLHSALTVRTEDGTLLMRDRWTMPGALLSLKVPGITGPHRAQGTLFVLRRSEHMEALIDGVRAVLPEHPRLYIAATRLPNNCGVMVRALCGDEPLLHTALRLVRDAARTLLRETGTVVLSAPADEAAQPAG